MVRMETELRNSMLCFGALVITFPAALHDGMAVMTFALEEKKRGI